MKAMPLLFNDTITMMIPDTFEVALSINSLALMEINILNSASQKHWNGLSGGYLMKIKRRSGY